MRIVAAVILLAGAALLVWLVRQVGVPEIGAALRAAGWVGLGAIVGFHLGVSALMGLAWGVLHRPTRLWLFPWARLVRDAGSEVLPLSQVGGYVLGARALIIHGVARASAAASTVVDVTLEFGAQIFYTALGLALVLWLRPRTDLILPVTVGLGASLLVIPAFVAVQRYGSSLLVRATARIARDWLSSIIARAANIQTEIRRIHQSRLALIAGFLLHFVAWVAAAVEAWIALRMMGAKIGFAPTLAIESLLYAIRSVAFMVPNAIGVQEGAYIMLGGMFGLPPDIALGLSLLKRGRDLVLGIPVLLVWQLVESRKYWKMRDAPPAAETAANLPAPLQGRAPGG